VDTEPDFIESDTETYYWVYQGQEDTNQIVPRLSDVGAYLLYPYDG